jgi:membrane protease subunit HflK
MERVLSHTRKVLVNDRSNNLMVLPLDQLMRGGQTSSGQNGQKGANGSSQPARSDSSASRNDTSSYSPDNIMDQRRANAQRSDSQREGRE